jgi:branched-chain amino acid aminotransferase
MKVWLDGDLLDTEEAHISPLDRGFLLGEGVFETFRSYSGRLPTAIEHLERLESSCRATGLRAPAWKDLLVAVRAVLRENELADARVRITATVRTTLVTASPVEPWPETATAVLVPWPHNERSPLAGVKTTSRAESLLALAHAHNEGADEALFLNVAGDLCEGTTTNVFLVRDGRVETPPLSAGCLPGITRGHVLLLCEELGIEAAETDISPFALGNADEMFLTSSTRGIQPLVAWPGGSTDSPGPITVRLQEQLMRRLESLPDV